MFLVQITSNKAKNQSRDMDLVSPLKGFAPAFKLCWMIVLQSNEQMNSDPSML
jgi:hypothetical protein